MPGPCSVVSACRERDSRIGCVRGSRSRAGRAGQKAGAGCVVSACRERGSGLADRVCVGSRSRASWAGWRPEVAARWALVGADDLDSRIGCVWRRRLRGPGWVDASGGWWGAGPGQRTGSADRLCAGTQLCAGRAEIWSRGFADLCVEVGGVGRAGRRWSAIRGTDAGGSVGHRRGGEPESWIRGPGVWLGGAGCCVQRFARPDASWSAMRVGVGGRESGNRGVVWGQRVAGERNGFRRGPVRARWGRPSPISCSWAERHTWHGQRRGRRQPSQRPSGSTWWVRSSRRQQSANLWSSVRAKGSSVDGSAWSAARSSMSRRDSTARRTVSSWCGHMWSARPSVLGRGWRPGPASAPDPAPPGRRTPRRPPAAERGPPSRPRPAPSARGPDRTDRCSERTI